LKFYKGASLPAHLRPWKLNVVKRNGNKQKINGAEIKLLRSSKEVQI